MSTSVREMGAEGTAVVSLSDCVLHFSALAVPVRCFTCGSVVSRATDLASGSTLEAHAETTRRSDAQTGNKWNPYLALLEQGHSEGEALDFLGLKRYWYGVLQRGSPLASSLRDALP